MYENDTDTTREYEARAHQQGQTPTHAHCNSCSRNNRILLSSVFFVFPSLVFDVRLYVQLMTVSVTSRRAFEHATVKQAPCASAPVLPQCLTPFPQGVPRRTEREREENCSPDKLEPGGRAPRVTKGWLPPLCRVTCLRLYHPALLIVVTNLPYEVKRTLLPEAIALAVLVISERVQPPDGERARVSAQLRRLRRRRQRDVSRKRDVGASEGFET